MEKLNNKEVVRIINYKQIAFYKKLGLNELYTFVNNNDGKIVFVFDKNESYPYFIKWCNTSPTMR